MQLKPLSQLSLGECALFGYCIAKFYKTSNFDKEFNKYRQPCCVTEESVDSLLRNQMNPPRNIANNYK